MKLRAAWGILKETVNEFLTDPALALAAATAYYAIFSMGPLLILAIGLAGLAFGEEQVRQEVTRQLQSFVGPKSTHLIESMMSAQFQGGSLLATLVGAVALLVGTTGAFSQLQSSLNTIWGVTAKPGHGLWLFIRDRLLSLAMVLAIGFLLLVSMVLSAFVTAFTHWIGSVTALPDWLSPAFDNLVSFLVISLLFALIFKFLPDVRIRWRDVWIGAVGTALLFTAGKYLLGLYLGHEISASAYGAASASVVLLIFVYYASLVLYFGAEFTQVYARRHGSRFRPSKYASITNPRKQPRRQRRRRKSQPLDRSSRQRARPLPSDRFNSGNGHNPPEESKS